jgi:hypothetical protein
MATPEMFGPAMLAVTQGLTSFHSFLPPISDIRKHNPQDNPDFAADVRMGELAAVTTTLGIGAIAASLTGSPVPAYTSILVSALLVALYESTLRKDRPFEPSPLTVPEGMTSDA